MNNRISVIIPVYNGERHVNRCYGSLCNQSCQQWEAVFVNDGSNDSSLALLERLAEIDSRVKVVSRPNTGVAKARADGIAVSTSEYITFLDVDDWLDSDGLEKALRTIERENADIIIGGLRLVNGKGIAKCIGYDKESLTFNSLLISLARQKINWSLCGNIYQKRLFDTSLEFGTYRAAEDYMLFVQLASNARKIITAPITFYNYSQEADSASHVKGTAYLEDAIKATLWCKDIFAANCSPEATHALRAITLLILSVCIRHRMSPTNRWAQRALKECLSPKSLRLLPLPKRLLVIAFAALAGLAPQKK